ncbi:MAG: PQQ-dependent sugar dehydrogenase, partial [Deltaproteobacteria bacterium]|nr:PQQ-dependent sugar dehydrogenase [Deltaproteobacteria bacterium]
MESRCKLQKKKSDLKKTGLAVRPFINHPFYLLIASLIPILFGFPVPSIAADYVIERVATGLERPVYATAPPEDFTRLFVVMQHVAEIRIIDLADDTLLETPFLDLGGQVSTSNEQGLLGLAFHPDYATNGYFYVNYTDTDGDTVVARYTVSENPNLADGSSAETLLGITQPQQNHNGGWLAFGSDGYLYIATGDGGGSRDPDGNAQNLESLLGKILRIDVDESDESFNFGIPADNPFVGVQDALPEIWVYGLRNPWRPGFDSETGDLYIADVGQVNREEVTVQPATSSGGENYGWRYWEGTLKTPLVPDVVPPPGAIFPIYESDHNTTPNCSITGGYVYRGPVHSMRGLYFYSDACNTTIRSLVWDGSAPADFDGTNYTDLTNWSADPDFMLPPGASLHSISSFGEDAARNLYFIDLWESFGSPNTGSLYRLPEPSSWLLATTAIATMTL